MCLTSCQSNKQAPTAGMRLHLFFLFFFVFFCMYSLYKKKAVFRVGRCLLQEEGISFSCTVFTCFLVKLKVWTTCLYICCFFFVFFRSWFRICLRIYTNTLNQPSHTIQSEPYHKGNKKWNNLNKCSIILSNKKERKKERNC